VAVRCGEEGSAPDGLRASTPVATKCVRIFPITRGSVMHARSAKQIVDIHDIAHDLVHVQLQVDQSSAAHVEDPAVDL